VTLRKLTEEYNLNNSTGNFTIFLFKVVLLPNTTMHSTSNVLLFRVLSKYSRIDRNIKRVVNCLDTTDSSANELDSLANESIVI
jgi:hypothetical protein